VSTTLGDDFPGEQKRVRELLEEYKSIGQAGSFGAMIITGVLERADKAAISGDILAILHSYRELKRCE